MTRPMTEDNWNDEHAAEVVVLAYTEGTKPAGIYLLDMDGEPAIDLVDRNLARAIAYRILRISDYLPAPEPLPVLRRLAEVDDALRDLEG